jgi:hypothetical protein
VEPILTTTTKQQQQQQQQKQQQQKLAFFECLVPDIGCVPHALEYRV